MVTDDTDAAPTPSRDPRRVRRMFDRIAPGYDVANTVLSFGRDGSWRRLAAAAAGLHPGDRALDVACGTGKLAVALQRRVGPSGHVVGLDFSDAMLAIARWQHPDMEWVQGDATQLPFDDAAFDAVTIAFGLRNLADPGAGLREMRRVVRPGGRLAMLEFLRPPAGTVGAVYRAYLREVLPRVGGWIARDRDAYRYLSTTVEAYLTPAEMLALAGESGWGSARLRRLNLGTVALLTAIHE